jgi:hypothetical protein
LASGDDGFPHISLEPKDEAAGQLIPAIAAEVGIIEFGNQTDAQQPG